MPLSTQCIMTREHFHTLVSHFTLQEVTQVVQGFFSYCIQRCQEIIKLTINLVFNCSQNSENLVVELLSSS